MSTSTLHRKLLLQPRIIPVSPVAHGMQDATEFIVNILDQYECGTHFCSHFLHPELLAPCDPALHRWCPQSHILSRRAHAFEVMRTMQRSQRADIPFSFLCALLKECAEGSRNLFEVAPEHIFYVAGMPQRKLPVVKVIPCGSKIKIGAYPLGRTWPKAACVYSMYDAASAT